MPDPKINVTIGANSKGFSIGLEKAKMDLVKFAKNVGGSFFGQYLGAQGVANALRQVASFIQNIKREADDILDMADAFGGDTSFVQRLKMDAEDANVSIEKLQGTMGTLAELLEKAKGGDSDSLMKLAAYGITQEDIQRMQTAADLFQAIRNYVLSLSDAEAASAKLLANLKEIGIQTRMLALMRTPDDPNRPGIVSTEDLKARAALDAQSKSLWRVTKTFASDAVMGAGELLKRAWNLDPRRRALAAFPRAAMEQGVEPLKLTDQQQKFLEEDRTRKSEEFKRKVQQAQEEAEFNILLDDLEEELAKDSAKKRQSPLFEKGQPLDTLARMGGYVGNAAGHSMQRDQLNELRGIRTELRTIKEELRTGRSESASGFARLSWD